MEEQNNLTNTEKKTKTIDEIIDENTSYFKFYEKAPMVFSIILGILFVAAAIAVAVLFENAGYFFLATIIGAIVCFIFYLLLKLFFSHIILQICYLKKIEENTRKD